MDIKCLKSFSYGCKNSVKKVDQYKAEVGVKWSKAGHVLELGLTKAPIQACGPGPIKRTFTFQKCTVGRHG